MGGAAIESEDVATTPTRLMTVEEFSKLPEDRGPVYHELFHGAVVAVTRAIYRHYTIQRRLRRLLEDLAPADGVVDIEFAYRPLPEHELWVADLAYVSGEREKGIDPKGYLRGAPDLVVEVLSPSNTAAEMYEKQQICLENGAKELWVIDAERRVVRISTPRGATQSWKAGQEIPLPLFGNSRMGVDAIFG